MRIALCIVVLLIACSGATGQVDPWTGNVTGLLTNVATTTANSTAIKNSAASISSDVVILKSYLDGLEGKLDANIQLETDIKFWLQLIAWWFPVWLGYRLWDDFHLKGVFHLGEKSQDMGR